MIVHPVLFLKAYVYNMVADDNASTGRVTNMSLQEVFVEPMEEDDGVKRKVVFLVHNLEDSVTSMVAVDVVKARVVALRPRRVASASLMEEVTAVSYWIVPPVLSLEIYVVLMGVVNDVLLLNANQVPKQVAFVLLTGVANVALKWDVDPVRNEWDYVKLTEVVVDALPSAVPTVPSPVDDALLMEVASDALSLAVPPLLARLASVLLMEAVEILRPFHPLVLNDKSFLIIPGVVY